MIVTHCGSEIVEGDKHSLVAKIKNLAKESGVEVEVACQLPSTKVEGL